MAEFIALTSLLTVNCVPVVEFQTVLERQHGQPAIAIEQVIVWDFYQTTNGAELHVRDWFKKESTEVTKVDGKWLIVARRRDEVYFIQSLVITETTSFTDAELADGRQFRSDFRRLLKRHK